jgi:hypothetical protein
VLHAIRVLAVPPIRGTPAWLGIGGPPGLRTKGSEEGGWMKGACPHFQIIGLMNDAAFLGPVVMQCENEILKGHEQSSRCYGGLNSRARRVEMRGETNRNAQSLSRHNPSRINKLRHVISTEWMGVGDQSPMNYSPHIFEVDP